MAILQTLSGGSSGTVLLITEGNTSFVKKVYPPEQEHRLWYQYGWLAERQDLNHVPRVLAKGHDAQGPFYTMEYRPGFRSFSEFIHSNPIEKSQLFLGQILELVDRAIHGDPRDQVSRGNLESYVVEKLFCKLDAAAKGDPAIAELLGHRELVINGQRVLGPVVAAKKILESGALVDDLSRHRVCPVHGDLTVENILIDGSTFLLIDPNGENTVSDPVVDYAKLYQSLHSRYELMCASGFRVQVSGNSLRFEERHSWQYAKLFETLEARLSKLLPDYSLRSLTFHEAIHFSRLLPYRLGVQSDAAPAFLGVCALLLNDYLAQFGLVRRSAAASV